MIPIIKCRQIHKWYGRFLILALLLGGVIIPGAETVSAKTLVFEDDFSGGLTKWESVRPNPKYWTADSGQAVAYVPYPSAIVELAPKPEYWQSSWMNIEYSFDYFTYEGSDKNFAFGYRDSQNWYELHFVPYAYNLVKVKDGQVVWSQWHGYGLSNGQKYAVKLILDQGHISLYLDGQFVAEDQDPDYHDDFGHITIKAGTGAVSPTRVAFDNIKVYLLDDVPLPPYVFKQSDPAWADTEYDSASVWSKDGDSIKRWGCALTSLAMVLKYHQITFLPDGQALNPDTLNTWLLNQPDGYFKEGNLNWQAGARLAKLSQQKYNTTKLEYSYLASDQTQTVNENISQNRPVVVAIPGHFLLADGLTSDQTDWTIRDPAYTYSLFSQHEVTASSFRLFTPSQTDLSYLMITHPPDVIIDIKPSDATDINVQNFVEYLSADEDTKAAKNNNLAITQVTKPQTGQYQISISQTKLSSAELKFYLYDVEGNVQVINYTDFISTSPSQFNLFFDADDVNQSYLNTKNLTFQNWADLLDPLYDNRDIKRKFAVIILKNAALTAQQNPPETKLSFVTHLKSLLDWLDPAMSSPAKAYLDQELDRISVI